MTMSFGSKEKSLFRQRIEKCLPQAALAVLALTVCVSRAAVGQCVPTFTATPLNVQQTYTFVTDSTGAANFPSTPCDPDENGISDTYADAVNYPEEPE